MTAVVKSTYSEPTTLWRLRHADGRAARGVVVPQSFGASVLWFIEEALQGAQDFPALDAAVEWAGSIRSALVQHGWMDDS